MYTTLLMSTGLTFGSIASLFGLSHHIIDQKQYSLPILTVIGSAVVPTVIANAFHLRHLLRKGDAIDDRGRNRFQRWVLGSVSQRVTAYAHCPVVVVR